MATPLAICDQTGRPIPPGDAPKGKWLRCWFCENARVQRRTSVKGNAFYSTYRGDEHTHPVCASGRTVDKHLEFENMQHTFHDAMTKDPKHGDGGPKGGGHNPPGGGDDPVLMEKLTSLRGLIKWGLFSCPDFQINKQACLSDIVINSAIAQTFFSDGVDINLGLRAIVARPESFDENLMLIRFALDYYPDPESDKRSIYFHMVTTLRPLFDELKDKLFQKNENGTGYVPKEQLDVIIYGDWNAHGCNWCKIRNRKTECAEESHCEKFVYESRRTKSNYVCAVKKKQDVSSGGK